MKVKEHQSNRKKAEDKKGNDIITITRANDDELKVTGLRKNEEKLIEEFLELEKKQNGNT